MSSLIEMGQRAKDAAVVLATLSTPAKNKALLASADALLAAKAEILAKNKAGLKALYQLVTESNLNFFYRRPRIPKRLLAAVRENLVLGSACEAGELIQTYIKTNKDHDALVKIAAFYDFLEVQPHGNNQFMLRKGIFQTEEQLKQINLDIYALGKELGKLVVATGDVHFANKDDGIYRAILMAGKKFEDADQQAPLYYRNTEEMLAEFDYFSSDVAKEIVITNPKKLLLILRN